MTNEKVTDLMRAATAHVAFDGWSEASFAAAAANCGLSLDDAHALCPGGAVDLAAAFHISGDDALRAWAAQTDLGDMRYSQKVARLVWKRIEISDDKELVRRGMTLFSLPQHSAQGASLMWGTADSIWAALGDTSDDLNWYSKRAILSAVFGSSVLFWLGDDSADDADTHAFIDRRISNVMQFEKLKGQVRKSKALGPLVSMLDGLTAKVRAPASSPRADYPGWVDQSDGDQS